jgi:hypothetical protein
MWWKHEAGKFNNILSWCRSQKNVEAVNHVLNFFHKKGVDRIHVGDKGILFSLLLEEGKEEGGIREGGGMRDEEGN